MENINPENIQEFNIPENLLDKLFNMTGNGQNNKGFIMAYVCQNGKPMVFTKTDTQIVEMGLRKALEEFLSEISEKERTYGLDSEEDHHE